MCTLVNTEYQSVYQQAISGEKLHRSRGGVGIKRSSGPDTTPSPPTPTLSAVFSGNTSLGHFSWAFPRGLLNPDHMKSLNVDDHLPEPGSLKNKETGSEKFQHNIVP